MHLFTHLRAKCAVLLGIGALMWCVPAMADEEESVYLPQFKLNFENEDTYADGWSLQNSDLSTEQVTLSNGSKGLLIKHLSNGSRTFFYTLTSASSAFASAKDYKLEFDWGSSAGQSKGTTQYSELSVSFSSGTSLFSIKQEWATTVGTVYNSSSEEIGKALVLDGATLKCPTVLYHFVIAGNEDDGVTLTITNESGEAFVDAVQLSETFQTPTKISGTVAKSYGRMLFDDIILSEKSEKLGVPILSLNNEDDEVTFTTPTGDVYYQIGENGEETKYESPITLTEDTEISYWSQYTMDGTTYYSDKTTTTLLAYGERQLVYSLDLTKTAVGTVVLGSDAQYKTRIGRTDYTFVTFTIGSQKINGLYSQSDNTSWLKRSDEGNALRNQSSGPRRVAIPNLQAGSFIEIYGGNAGSAFVPEVEENGTKDVNRSVADSRGVFKVTSDGYLVLSIPRTSTIKQINIYAPDKIRTSSKLNSATHVGTFYWSRTVEIPEGVQAFAGTYDADENTFTLSEVKEYIPSNTPVILSAPELTEVTFTAVDNCVDDVANNSLSGTLLSDVTTSSIATDDNTTVWVISSQADGSDFGFYKYEGEKIAANRAYLVVTTATEGSDSDSDAAEAPKLRFPDDWTGTIGNVTGIENISATAPANSKTIYNLQGNRVLNTNRPGLYIVGGKVMVVR